MNIDDESGSTTATATFATSNETFSISQTPSVSSSKVEDIEEEPSNRKKVFLGIVLLMWIFLVLFLVRCLCPSAVH